MGVKLQQFGEDEDAMAESGTGIEWTDETWNPVEAYDPETGRVGTMCTPASPGCMNCYAERLNVQRRYGRGTGQEFNASNSEKVEFRLAKLDKPWDYTDRSIVFVNSMTDLFHKEVSESQIRLLFSIMASVRRHSFQVLTKRPERMAHIVQSIDWRAVHYPARLEEGERSQMLTRIACRDGQPPEQLERLEPEPGRPMEDFIPPNIWLGTSVENQEWANKRMPHLLDTPAAIRFLSCEPLIGEIDFRQVPAWEDQLLRGIDWVIIGGESGHDVRRMDLDWAEQLLEQSREAGVAPFVKQLGSRWAEEAGAEQWMGKKPEEWPEKLRIREFPK